MVERQLSSEVERAISAEYPGELGEKELEVGLLLSLNTFHLSHNEIDRMEVLFYLLPKSADIPRVLSSR